MIVRMIVLEMPHALTLMEALPAPATLGTLAMEQLA